MLPPPAHFFPDFPAEDQRHHHDAILLALRRTLESGNFILGNELAAFERELAHFLGIPHVIGVGSGTDAIELLLRTLDLPSESTVVLPTLAPSAVAAAVRRAGLQSALVDVEDETLTLCPRALEALLAGPEGASVKVVLAVHLHGHPVAWEPIRRICEERGIVLLEDAAQAHGSIHAGTMAGALGWAAAMSFYPTKNLGAAGDAGAISTRDDALAEKLRRLRQYGWKTRHISETDGINSRLDEVQAAILRVKLPSLACHNARRGEIAARYTKHLHGVRLPVQRPGCTHAWHQFVIRTGRRDELRRHLELAGIPSAVHYPAALHQQPAFAHAGTFPYAERAVAEVLSLPMHPYLSDAAVDAVCAAVNEFTRP